MSPQLQTVLKLFQNFCSLSTAEAATVYKIRSLPTRIFELKALGYNIDVEIKRDPTGQRYARYTLDESIKEDSVVVVVKPMYPTGYGLNDIGVVTEVQLQTEMDKAGYYVQFKHKGARPYPVFVLADEVKLVKTQEPVDAPITVFNVEDKPSLGTRIHNFIKGFKVHAA
jgi:hypothetical protein